MITEFSFLLFFFFGELSLTITILDYYKQPDKMGSEFIAQMQHIEPPNAFQTDMYQTVSSLLSHSKFNGNYRICWFIVFPQASIALMSCPKSMHLVCKHDKHSQTAEYVT